MDDLDWENEGGLSDSLINLENPFLNPPQGDTNKVLMRKVLNLNDPKVVLEVVIKPSGSTLVQEADWVKGSSYLRACISCLHCKFCMSVLSCHPKMIKLLETSPLHSLFLPVLIHTRQINIFSPPLPKYPVSDLFASHCCKDWLFWLEFSNWPPVG